MGEVMQGKDRILLVRRLDEAATKKAMKPLFQIEHEWEFSRESSGTQTKDGVANAVSGLEVTLSLSGLASRDDENLYMKDAVEDGILMEFWDVDLKGEKNAEGKYPAIYAQGYVNSWSLPANIEELVEIETEASINGKPQDGFATVEADIIAEAQYAFQDTVPEKAPQPGE
ncbi:phage major tail protein, TP901-1 family [Enterococcus faecalis]|uniref:phage major tail protein, TP901-1 family n=1 Tax=Enterococcus TaxID=1350 RepID=UPI001C6FEBC3|nr:phage major tail protein, TP901-1 family [Enterococcus faecalis]MBW9292230.1 phage major tail protein, TP901-1 family [Enterococcus faecalis]